jgi:hypothetical protein
MAFLGSTNGPRESEIVQRLGHTYFGISPSELEDDISAYEDSERRNEVQPVFLDPLGLAYVKFAHAGLQPQRFYLSEHGYSLGPGVLTRTEST